MSTNMRTDPQRTPWLRRDTPAAPRSAFQPLSEVWLLDPAEPLRWHLAERGDLPALCGRPVPLRRASIWTVHDSEMGPPLADRCQDCCDELIRTFGRLPIA